MPDWDYWRTIKFKKDPNFSLSHLGSAWRSASVFPPFLHSVLLRYVNHAPLALYYLYWLIHNPRVKGLGPYQGAYKIYNGAVF